MRKLDDKEQSLMREKLLELCYENEYNKFIGVEFMELNENYSKARMKFRKEILNPYGFIHGGAILSFVDIVAGYTACMCGHFVTTVNSNLNFLLPAKGTEYIYCECMKLKTGRHILVYDIRITDDKGNIVDSGEYSYFATNKKVMD